MHVRAFLLSHPLCHTHVHTQCLSLSLSLPLSVSLAFFFFCRTRAHTRTYTHTKAVSFSLPLSLSLSLSVSMSPFLSPPLVLSLCQTNSQTLNLIPHTLHVYEYPQRRCKACGCIDSAPDTFTTLYLPGSENKSVETIADRLEVVLAHPLLNSICGLFVGFLSVWAHSEHTHTHDFYLYTPGFYYMESP